MISDLQLAIGGVVIVIIVAVIAYNRWQESKYKKRAEQAFGTSHPDVLIDEPLTSSPAPSSPMAKQAGQHERVEPRLGAASPLATSADDDFDDLTPIGDVHVAPTGIALSASTAAKQLAPRSVHSAQDSSIDRVGHGAGFGVGGGATLLPSAPTLHSDIDSIALILADAPIEAAQYESVITQSKLLGKGVRWEGMQGGLWQPITLPAIDAYRELRVGLQLADRRGPVDALAITQFNEMVAQYAASVGAVSQREETPVAMARAQAVDALCADTDIEIVVNVVGKSGVTFAVTKVRGLAESNGLVATESGEYVMQDDHGRTLYTLRNIDPAEPPGIKRSTGYLSGLTFAVDVPRTPDAARTFERMFLVVMKIADVLQGEVVDDNRKVLTASGRKVISDTITSITAQMEARGIAAGSATALRLYA